MDKDGIVYFIHIYSFGWSIETTSGEFSFASTFFATLFAYEVRRQ